MSLKIWVGGARKTASTIKVKVGGAVRSVQSIRVYSGGALRTVFVTGGGSGGTFGLSISPSEVTGNGSAGSGSVVISDVATATPSGGVGPYTYSWSRVSGSTAIEADIPNFASTTFSALMGPPNAASASFRCTATDSLGSTATADVTCTLTNLGTP